MFSVAPFMAIFTTEIIFVYTQHSIRSFDIKAEHLNKRLLGHLLYESYVSEHHPCITECIFLGACESVNFNRRNRRCELNDESIETAPPSNLVEEAGTIFFDIKELQFMAGVCAGNKCTYEERCYPTGDAYSCITIECGNTPDIRHGVFQPGANIAGNTRTFSCLDGLVVDGDENITCLHNGTWTHFEATCRHECGNPPDIQHGVFQPGANIAGNTRTFSCLDGLVVDGDENITCLHNGTWTLFEATCRHEYKCDILYYVRPDYSQFDPHADGIRVDESTAIVFQVKGTNDACIMLQHDRDVFEQSVIEVLIGGAVNTVYSLFVTQGNDVSYYYPSVIQPAAILSTEVYRWFWISWNEGCVKVGAGNIVGLNVGLSWCDLEFTVSGIRLGFGWNGQGYFLF